LEGFTFGKAWSFAKGAVVFRLKMRISTQNSKNDGKLAWRRVCGGTKREANRRFKQKLPKTPVDCQLPLPTFF
jgi:hypothetical protein